MWHVLIFISPRVDTKFPVSHCHAILIWPPSIIRMQFCVYSAFFRVVSDSISFKLNTDRGGTFHTVKEAVSACESVYV